MIKQLKYPMNKIIELIEKEGKPMSPGDILSKLGDDGDNAKAMSAMHIMVNEGLIMKSRKGKMALPEHLGYIIGKLQGNPKGFAFLIPDIGDSDLFIPAEGLNGGMHGDRVMARSLRDEGRGAKGEIVKVIDRANKEVVGVFDKDKYFGFVVPDNKRLGRDIFIPKSEFQGAKEGQRVVAKINRWPEKRRNPEGSIIEILGDAGSPGVDILAIVRQHGLKEDFDYKTLNAAKKVPSVVDESMVKGREDLRDMKIVTIDGADAKDLDDAVSVERMENGNYMLGVHIADVSNYVAEGNPLDAEAKLRGTSVYFPDRVVPMLPRELSNGICSLNPKVDRLTMSVMMEIDDKGDVIDYVIAKSVIKTTYRMTYQEVSSILEDNNPELIMRYRDVHQVFLLMKHLYGILKSRRRIRGSIDFDLPEAKIELDDNGVPIKIEPYSRRISNRIIEEFMLICNETVAKHMYYNKLPFLYRVHEEPSAERMGEFAEFIRNFGYKLKGSQTKVHPKALQNVLEEVEGSREENIINNVMLRSLKKAKYYHENLGHFALAAQYYCHFTSPIRRYPDLMIHRIIKASLDNFPDNKLLKKWHGELPALAEHCSDMEKAATEAEREADDMIKAQYMKNHIGDEFDGVVSGVTSWGLFVGLYNTVEGLVPMAALDDDYYIYDKTGYQLIGERKRKIYRLGDKVRIRVVSADPASRRTEFELIDD